MATVTDSNLNKVHLNNKAQNAVTFWRNQKTLGDGKELSISYIDPENKKSLIGSFPKKRRFKTPLERRRSRFYAALIQAFWERPYPKRWFVLTLTSKTTSMQNNEQEIKKHFQALVKRWRRRGQFEYMGVVEKGKGGMVHIHVVAYGDYVPQTEISNWWNDIHGAPIVFVESVYHYMQRKGISNRIDIAIKLLVGYVTKYLMKQNLSQRVLKSRNFDTLERRLMRTGKRMHTKIVELKYEKWLFKHGHAKYIIGYKAVLETKKGLQIYMLPIGYMFDGVLHYPRGDLTDDDFISYIL